MEKVDFKRAKFSGFLDVLGFLAALVMTAGYIVVDLVKVSGLPDGCLLYTSPSPRDS